MTLSKSGHHQSELVYETNTYHSVDFDHREYILHLFITRENAFVAKIVGSRRQDFAMPV